MLSLTWHDCPSPALTFGPLAKSYQLSLRPISQGLREGSGSGAEDVMVG